MPVFGQTRFHAWQNSSFEDFKQADLHPSELSGLSTTKLLQGTCVPLSAWRVGQLGHEFRSAWEVCVGGPCPRPGRTKIPSPSWPLLPTLGSACLVSGRRGEAWSLDGQRVSSLWPPSSGGWTVLLLECSSPFKQGEVFKIQ